MQVPLVGTPLTEPARRGRCLKLSLAASIATLGLVSGVMHVAWWLSADDPRLQGVYGYYDYASATWGDALFLPIMAGSATYTLCSLPAQQKERRFAVLGFALGCSLGALPQVVSFLDPDPVLNWTLPQPHSFTGAGIYHAIIGTLWAGLLGAAIAVITLRRIRSDSIKIGARVSLGLLLVASGGFLVLAGLDSSRSARNQLSVWVPLAFGWVALAAILTIPIFINVFRPRERSSKDVR